MQRYTIYHGTNNINANKIIMNGFKTKRYFLTQAPQQQRMPGDLGSGIYGYINREPKPKFDALSNAYKFISKFESKNEATVLKLNVETEDDESILDMDDEDNIELINSFRESEQYQKAVTIFNYVKGDKRRKILDGIILENIIQKGQLNEKVKMVIKDTYTPFRGLMEHSHYPNGTEACIRQKEIIRSIDRVEYDERGED